MPETSAPETKTQQTQAEHQALAAVLGRNTIFSYLGRFWGLGIALLLTPYVYYKLGDELFGVWALLATLTGYTGLVDLVSAVALTKYVAEAHARDDVPAMNGLVSTGLAIHAGLAVVVMGAAWLLADHALALVKVSPGAHAQARAALLLCVAGACAGRLTSVFGCVLEGLQRLDVTNSLRMAVATAQAGGTVLVLQLGYGIVGLAWNSAAVWAIQGAGLVMLARRHFPALKPSLRLWGRDAACKLAVFTLKRQAAVLGYISMVNTDRLILGAVLGPAKVAPYELGRRPVMAVHTGVAPIISPMIPAASQLGAQADRARLEALFLRASKYVALLSGAGMALLVAIGPQALTAWLGKFSPNTLWVMNILAVGYTANMLTAPAAGMGYGLGRPEFAMWRGFLLVAVQVGLGLVLVQPFGSLGPAAATTVALVSSSLICVWLVARHCLGLTLVTSTLRAWLGPLLAGAVPAGAVYGLVQLLDRTGAFPGRGGDAGLAVIGGAAFVLLWTAIALATGLVAPEDMRLVRTAVRSVVAPNRPLMPSTPSRKP